MRDDPFFALVKAPQFGTRQKEQTPIDIPLSFLALAVGLCQDGFQFAATPTRIQIIQPPIRSAFVVRTIDAPVLRDAKVLGKVQQQIIAGHGTTGKEIVRHPALVKMVGVILVRKNVHKQLATRFQESFYLGQELLIILHVFEHFDSHYQIVTFYNIKGTLIVGNIALVTSNKPREQLVR